MRASDGMAGPRPAPPTEHLDVLIVGAGLSGISAAWHVQTLCRGSSYAILEAREQMGGTWDLFRYPGIRSDSDMMTFGYRFAPWIKPQILADGGSIKAGHEEAEAMEDDELGQEQIVKQKRG